MDYRQSLALPRLTHEIITKKWDTSAIIHQKYIHISIWISNFLKNRQSQSYPDGYPPGYPGGYPWNLFKSSVNPHDHPTIPPSKSPKAGGGHRGRHLAPVRRGQSLQGPGRGSRRPGGLCGGAGTLHEGHRGMAIYSGKWWFYGHL